MAAKLKVDELESVDGSTNLILNNSVTMASGKTLPAANLTGTLPAISGANLTGVAPTKSTVEALGIDVPAANLTGTVANARFPATLPAASAANLTAIPAANITGTLPAISGANLTGIVGVPTGVIVMWHGASSAIPSGWVICDGNNSTPNLSDKFIKSAGTANATGGGTTSGAHTLSTAEMPSHTHNMNVGGTAYQSNQPVGTDYYNQTRYTMATGGGGSHTHSQAEPVYFALIFIMKT